MQKACKAYEDECGFYHIKVDTEAVNRVRDELMPDVGTSYIEALLATQFADGPSLKDLGGVKGKVHGIEKLKRAYHCKKDYNKGLQSLAEKAKKKQKLF